MASCVCWDEGTTDGERMTGADLCRLVGVDGAEFEGVTSRCVRTRRTGVGGTGACTGLGCGRGGDASVRSTISRFRDMAFSAAFVLGFEFDVGVGYAADVVARLLFGVDSSAGLALRFLFGFDFAVSVSLLKNCVMRLSPPAIAIHRVGLAVTVKAVTRGRLSLFRGV